MPYPDDYKGPTWLSTRDARRAQEIEELSDEDSNTLYRLARIFESIETELADLEKNKNVFRGDVNAHFRESIKARLALAQSISGAFINSGKLRIIVKEAIDGWLYDDIVLCDYPVEDFGQALFNRLEGEVNDGEFEYDVE